MDVGNGDVSNFYVRYMCVVISFVFHILLIVLIFVAGMKLTFALGELASIVKLLLFAKKPDGFLYFYLELLPSIVDFCLAICLIDLCIFI